MIEISGFRIRAEVEKVFKAKNPGAIREALEAFAAFLPPMLGLDTLHHFLRQGEGNTAFLWAALLLDEKPLKEIGLSTKDQQFALECLLNKPNYYSHSEEEFRLIEQFQVAIQMRQRHKALAALAPYKTPEEKVRGLGFDGHYLMSLGFKGKDLGRVVESLNQRMSVLPESSVSDLNDVIAFCAAVQSHYGS